MMEVQSVFPFVFAGDFGGERFHLGAPNRQAVSLLQQALAQPSGFVLVHGAKGSGKTHLATAIAQATGCALLSAEETRDLSPSSAPWLVDNLDRLRGQESLQEAWVHRINSLDQGHLLVFAETVPAMWPVEEQLPDFLSRMNGLFTSAELLPPDDALLGKVLHKMATDRQFHLNDDHLGYCLSRMARSFSAAEILVDTLDRLTLSRQKKVSKATLRMALDMCQS